MIQDTKLIKQILKENFYGYKFSIQIKKPSQYIDYSDTIIIVCDKNIKDDVIKLIQQYISGIKIYNENSMASINRDADSKIYDILSKNWINVDAQFIMIKEIER